ncbi:MAG: NAD-dependent epimerase/dehydratase family protein [Sciscionella sp.]|nr:NAD-dependent epimerase/dehydratase family protein [Sciscionella sp.]
MTLHVVAGSGAVGSAVAEELLRRGEKVRMITRSGTGVDGTEKVAADAGDAAKLRELTEGAYAIYNCVNPAYHRWTTDWPPIASALLSAAEANGSVLAITGNLYGYGAVDVPMTEATQLRPRSVKGQVRVTMWEQALAAHKAGKIPGVLEVRGSDYLGASPFTLLSMMVLPRARAGKPAMIPADLDAPHSWTNPADMGRLLVDAAADERGWGKAWHVPSAPAISIRELCERAAKLGDIENLRLRALPPIALTIAGLFDVRTRAFKEMNYQFRRPFVLEAPATERVFGGDYTPLDDSIRQNLSVA